VESRLKTFARKDQSTSYNPDIWVTLLRFPRNWKAVTYGVHVFYRSADSWYTLFVRFSPFFAITFRSAQRITVDEGSLKAETPSKVIRKPAKKRCITTEESVNTLGIWNLYVNSWCRLFFFLFY